MPKPASDSMAKAASAVGARTARACDGCMRRRARWHCPADDAYLCQACDVSVHSANPLARRHHRVRLATASSSVISSSASPSSPPLDPSDPSWLHSLKRRARTPRGKPRGAKAGAAGAVTATAVPDLEAEDEEEQERVASMEELVYRVPVFDQMLAELCDVPADGDQLQREMEMKPYTAVEQIQPLQELAKFQMSPGGSDGGDGFAGFHVSDADLAAFAADMESLLTGVLGENGAGLNDLGFLQDVHDHPDPDEEKPDMYSYDMSACMKSESSAPPVESSEAREDKNLMRSSKGAVERKKAMMLSLDYEGVISSWSHEGCSPWFHGEHPRLKPGEHLLDFTAARRGVGGLLAPATGGEREARVSRYREKRRSRLFAKKIRYEVRKLNAEKRPRMKGRFVKRSAFPPAVPPVPKFASSGQRRFAF